MRFFTRIFSALLCLIFLFLFLSQGQLVAEAVLQGIHLCLDSIIPSLFCFMVLTNFLIFSGIYRTLSRPFAPLTKILFHLPPQVGSVIFLSFLGGYPAGAVAIRSLLSQKIISPKQAKRMLSFCCCAGPSFIVTAIGSQMFGSTSLGILLLSVHLLSSVLIGGMTGLFSRLHHEKACPSQNIVWKAPPSLNTAFVTAVEQSVLTCGKMCGFILLFQAVAELLSPMLQKIPFAPFLLGLLEVTNGCRMAVSMGYGIFAACFFLSFGGICVLSQISGILHDFDVSISCQLPARFFHGLLACLLLYRGIKAFPQTLEVFSSVCHPVPMADSATPILSFCLMMMSLLLMFRAKGLMEK